jgi:citrate synthase
MSPSEKIDRNEKAVAPGLAGVPVAESAVSFIDGTKGLLSYRGYRIEDLAERSTFEEVSWLLLTGELPAEAQLAGFRSHLARHRQLPDRLVRALEAMPGKAHPMDVLQAGLSMLGMFHEKPDPRDPEAVDEAFVRLLAAAPVIVATFDRLRNGKDLVAPDPDLGHAAHFLWRLNGTRPDELAARVFDAALILHAEHGMNASTFAARVVTSTEADPYAACSAAIGALHGVLHGGANEKVLEQLRDIGPPENVTKWLDARLATKSKVMGFGHRVYKVKDPRAIVLQGLARELFQLLGSTPLYDTALELERQMEERVGAKGIYPNVDFFSGIVYSKLGIAPDLFTPVFGLSRVAGYLAHWREQMQDNKLYRPAQVYVGERDRTWVPMRERLAEPE